MKQKTEKSEVSRYKTRGARKSGRRRELIV